MGSKFSEYAGARYYAMAFARWLSVDPAGGNPTDPQGLNLYGYVGNDPVNKVDRTGASEETVGGLFFSGPCRPQFRRSGEGTILLTGKLVCEAYAIAPYEINPGRESEGRALGGPSPGELALEAQQRLNNKLHAGLLQFLKDHPNCDEIARSFGHDDNRADNLRFYDVRPGSIWRKVRVQQLTKSILVGGTLGQYIDNTGGAIATTLSGRDPIDRRLHNTVGIILVSGPFFDTDFLRENGLTQAGIVFHEYLHVLTKKDDLALAMLLHLGEFGHDFIAASKAISSFVEGECQ